jgi:hypothetical protein
MVTTSIRVGEFSVFCRLTPMWGLIAGLGLACSAIGPAHAQVNIDQGKSAAEIFAGDCATCHKSARGLANGRNSLTLSAFLREHYTSSSQQASMLAAYVLGAGAGPPPAANLKQGADRKTAVEEPRSGETRTGEPKAGEPKAGEPKAGEPKSKTAARPAAAANSDEIKIEQEPAESTQRAPGRRPARRHETRPVTASRGPRQEPETPTLAAPQTAPAPEPAPAVSEPAPVAPVATAPANPEPASPPNAPAEKPAPAMPATAAAPSNSSPEAGARPGASAAFDAEASPATGASAPAESAPSESAPVPRDDIPD